MLKLQSNFFCKRIQNKYASRSITGVKTFFAGDSTDSNDSKTFVSRLVFGSINRSDI